MFVKKFTWLGLSISFVLITTVIFPLWFAKATAENNAAIPAFKPKVTTAPARRIGGGTRGPQGNSPLLAVLAPEHVGQTINSQPSLYWSISKPTDKQLTFTVIYANTEKGIDPIIETTIPISGKGIQLIDLAKQNITLETNAEYEWSLALITDPKHRSNDIVSTGIIKRIPPPAELSAKLAKTNEKQHPMIYAEAGLWYDAIDALSKLIAKEPNNNTLLQQQTTLLKQVGFELKHEYSREFVVESL
jgi:hypothetical protein